MSLSNTLASLATLEATVAPVTPSVSFRFWVSKEPRMVGLLVADLYLAKAPGYVEALFSALESAGVNYRAPKFPLLIKVYSGKVRVNTKTIGHPLAIVADESITAWLDRVAFDPQTKAIGIEIDSAVLTKGQVKQLHASLAAPKFEKDALATNGLVHSFTFIAPPNLAPGVRQFTRTVEHLDAVPLPLLHVPAGHVEPAAPIEHVEAVGDVPTFAIEPLIPIEEPPADESVAIIEVDSLDAMAFSELKVLFKKEFRYNAPLNIRRDDLKMLINAKRDSAF